MIGRVINGRAPVAGTWRLHGYTKNAVGFTCMLISPDGVHVNESLADFAQQDGGREWSNNPEDIQAMLDLALMEEMRHG